jgi:hypothetical protein
VQPFGARVSLGSILTAAKRQLKLHSCRRGSAAQQEKVSTKIRGDSLPGGNSAIEFRYERNTDEATSEAARVSPGELSLTGVAVREQMIR